jgi:hypothetical protein
MSTVRGWSSAVVSSVVSERNMLLVRLGDNDDICPPRILIIVNNKNETHHRQWLITNSYVETRDVRSTVVNNRHQ